MNTIFCDGSGQRSTIRWAVVLMLILAACGDSESRDGGVAATTTTVPSSDAPPSPTGAVDPPGDEAGTTTTASTVAVAGEPEWSELALSLEPIARVDAPIALVGRSGTGDLYVAEKGGRVRLIARTVTPNRPDRFALRSQPVLDLSDQVSSGSEQGLLDIAFSADGGQLFVSYTDRNGNNVVARYPMNGPNVRVQDRIDILGVEQPFANHNGGGLAFGPDGFLYVGLGDGGRAGDPLGNGQDPSTLLGSLLRIDPDGAVGAAAYAIPEGNPFVDGGGAPEVWLYGVRNPWRFSFDPPTGDLWIADVGQNRFEEVNRLHASSSAGANLGWNEMEGFEPYEGGRAPEDHTPPVLAYAHEGGRCSVTGGYVYRGHLLPLFDGVYVFGDYCSGEIFGAAETPGGVVFRTLNVAVNPGALGSFGVDNDGELYALALDGAVNRLIPSEAG